MTYLATYEIAIIFLSAILFAAAKPITAWLNPDNVVARASLMRLLNALIIIAVLIKLFLLRENAWIGRTIQSLIIIYFAMLSAQVINYLIRRRFGKVRITKDKATISDTYSSRGLSIFASVIIALIAAISCLKALGLNSLLEAGGVLGILGFFLAMTQASWAPDIFSGLIILNSRICEEGDVIQLNMDGKTIIATVFKTKLFHSECLDLANNHRIMIGNKKLRDLGIHNLSRFASARGLRECLLFNIDYAQKQSDVEAMFKRAFEAFDTAETIREEQYEAEIRVYDTGDNAVTWAVFYYLKDVKKVLAVRQTLRAYILKESIDSEISLATPQLQSAAIKMSPPETIKDT